MMTDALLPAVAAGDHRALRTCMDRHRPVVRALVRRLGRDDVDDVMQEVFVEAWKAAHRFDGRASERTFVLTIARRRLIDRWRKERRSPLTELPDGDECADTGAFARVESSPDVTAALEVLGRIREDRRTVFMLFACHGMSHAEIAETMDMPIGTVKTHIRRVSQELRDALTGRAEQA